MKARPVLADHRVRALRPPRQPVDPWQYLGVTYDTERTQHRARPEQVATVFLAGAECPFSCVFCDLWRFTVDGRTPVGAIPAQLRAALDALDAAGQTTVDRVKLYNASNFFDARAVPSDDDGDIAEAVAAFPAVTVECHPKLVGERCFRFAERLDGELEVAMGLETAHPRAHARLNKGCTLEETRAAAQRLLERGLRWRAFVLVGVPFLAPGDQLEWTVRSVEMAVAEGATVVSLIPVRGGNGELERLAAAGHFVPPSAELIEAVLEATVENQRAVVQLDLWDLEQHLCCSACAPARRARLERMNTTGVREVGVDCAQCS